MRNACWIVLLSVVGTMTAGAASYPVGDLNTDRKVDFTDLRILADSWLEGDCQSTACPADLDGDGSVTLADFTRLGLNWRANFETPVINEFMASNGSRQPLGEGGLLDADGDSSDWIELYNPTERVFDLSGWYLTDSTDDLTKWQFPSGTSLRPNGYLVVFASGKNRTTGQLHTNFQLAARGEYLALVKSDGRTVADEYAGGYPEQLTDISYGLGQSAAQFISSGSTVSYHVPGPEDADRDWTAVDFDDDGWPTATASLGFWQTSQLVGRDIGSPSVAGSYEAYSETTYMLLGDGADIGGSADSFYYLYMPLRGDGELTARVLGMVDTDPWAKAGVMIRETLAAGSRHATQVVSALSGTAFLRRTTTSGASVSAQGNGYKPPYWIRISRRGNIFSGYYSANGVNWAQQGTETIAMSQDASVGLCVTSRAAGIPCSAVFDNVTFGSQTNNLLRDRMLGVNASVWVRAGFEAEETAFYDSLRLAVRYEDGFVAWLNGVEVARADFTGTPRWDSAAGSDRSDLLMGEPAVLDLSRHKGLLRDGRNVLAVQGLNDNKTNPVFLIAPEMSASGQIRVPQYFVAPTPGKANISGAVDLVATPELSHERGFYSTAFALSIFCNTPGATIRYTTDGTKPTEVSGLTYAKPIPIGTTTCLRVGAFKPGWMSSPVQTHTYLFLDQVSRQPRNPSGFPATWGGTNADYEMDPDVVNNALYRNQLTPALLSLPTMSIVATVDDLFGTKGLHGDPWGQGVQWERPVSVEWIHPDGATGFQVDAGLRIYGGAFRGYNLTRKKTFRLMFKREYGPTKLNFRLFEEEDATTSFDMIILRGGANDGWNDWGKANTQYIVDEFVRRTQLALGQVAVHGTFVHLYLNGLYWGLYNVTERPVEPFCAAYYGGDEEEWDAVNRGEARGDSNLTTWNAMLSRARAGLSDPASYQRIQGNDPDGTRNPAYDDLLDVDNYIDYMFSNFWGGTGDWPGHNYYAACRRPPNSTGFKFFNWDSEGAIVIWSSLNANVTNVRDGAAIPYAALRPNPEFCLLFADHVQKHMFSDGPATPGASYARYKKLADQVDLAIIAESARWGDQSSATPYTLADWRKTCDYILDTYMPQRPAIVLDQLKSAGLYPAVAAPVFHINGAPRQGGEVPSDSLLTMSVTRGQAYYTMDGSDPRLPAGQSVDGKIVTLLAESAPKRVLVPSVANGGNLLSNIPAGFQVTYYKSTVAVDNIATAESVISDRTRQATTANEQARVINYFNTGGTGNFPNDRAFPGTTLNADVEDFVVLVTGRVMIPAAGEWTFGVNSDDGYSMTLTRRGKTYTSAYPDPRSPGDTLTVFNILDAGSHDLRLVFYERGGGSELELFAARGNLTSFDASRFRLVGDVGAGGLQVGEGSVWYTNTFNDSSWTSGAGGVGYERSSGYQDYFEIDVENEMYGINGSCYIRIPFTVTKTGFSNVILKIRYDDGFIAYLNGAEVARQNFTGEPAWNSVASSGNSDEAAVGLASFDVSDSAGLLWEGTNLLAIHGLNTSIDSSDLLISVELAAGEISQGVVSPRAVEFSSPVLLTESTPVKARTFDGRWSALNEAVYGVGHIAESLRISEIMYHPLDTGNPGDPNTEYIELTNIGAGTINLKLVRFTNGVDFTFPSCNLAPGGYCLVVKDAAAFAGKYGTDLPVAGQYSGSLDNAGERLELRDAVGTVIHGFRFDDDWFDITDGLGFSLTLRDPKTADPSSLGEKGAWRPGSPLGGTPGVDDAGGAPEPGAVVVNELLANSQGVGPDWIELYNTTDQAIDIGGWFLTDDADDLTKYRIAAGTNIPAGGYLVFDEDQHFGNPDDPGCREPFALSRDGETVYLHSGSAGALAGGYGEQQKFEASDAGISLGRHAKSTGGYDFVALSRPTPGAANADPLVGPVVINEIMYNPGSPADAEYVELLNISGDSVTLYDATERTPWRFTDDPDAPGLELRFPSNPAVTLAAGEYLLLVKDLNLFAAKYTPSAGVTIFAWGEGNLANGGEKIQLSRPGGQNLDGTRNWIRVDRVNYSDGLHPEEFPSGIDLWPATADGQGSSLGRVASAEYGNDPMNWEAAAPSPGSAN
ncbi:MAG: lamin tail domain-containing protein [Sedimentisphaerales bacterium]|nr:lamin tail domain-containing protein [Sedimentisphaerales bacterium]